MTLDNGNVGKTYQVSHLDLDDVTGKRLEALGLTKGTNVELMNHKRNGSIIFKVRGTRLAVGKKIAHAIKVEEM